MPRGCFGFLPLRGWLLTTDPTRFDHQGLAIFFECRVQGALLVAEMEDLFIFLKPAC